MTKEGWIKIYRKLGNSKFWLSEKFTRSQAWVDLLLLANHKEGMIIVRGNIIKIKRGQVGWSEVRLAKRWKWGRTRVRNFIKYLKNEQQIEQHKNFKSSIITILKYEEYQKTNSKENSRRTADEQQTNTNKNVKNDKNLNTECFFENKKTDSQDFLDEGLSLEPVEESFKTREQIAKDKGQELKKRPISEKSRAFLFNSELYQHFYTESKRLGKWVKETEGAANAKRTKEAIKILGMDKAKELVTYCLENFTDKPISYKGYLSDHFLINWKNNTPLTYDEKLIAEE